jgi:hypothetical protein
MYSPYTHHTIPTILSTSTKALQHAVALPPAASLPHNVPPSVRHVVYADRKSAFEAAVGAGGDDEFKIEEIADKRKKKVTRPTLVFPLFAHLLTIAGPNRVLDQVEGLRLVGEHMGKED